MSNELLDTIQEQLDTAESVAASYVKIELTRFVWKWGLIAVLYALLIPRFPWLQYTLLIALPVAVFLLYSIFAQKKKLDNQVADIRKSIKEIQAVMPDDLLSDNG